MKGMWIQLVISLLFYSCTLSLAILLHPSPADIAVSTLDIASNSQVNNLAGVNNNNNKRKLTARIYRELHRLNKPPVKTIQVLQQLTFLSPLGILLFSSLGFFSSVVFSWNPFSFFSSVVVFSWILLSVLFLLEFFLIMFSSSELLHSSSSMFVVCSFLEIHVKKLHVSPCDCRLHFCLLCFLSLRFM